MCKNWLTTKSCKFGDKVNFCILYIQKKKFVFFKKIIFNIFQCSFAHGKEELLYKNHLH